jgi:hypothetical protein
MRSVIDYSKDLRRKLAEAKTLDQGLRELRDAGASIFDCIASVRSLHHCDLAEAKRTVESSSAWADVVDATNESFRELSGDENKA